MVYKITLFGPQGSGKGTQADLLSAEFGIYHFSPGAQYRAEIQKGSEIGKIAAQYINHGMLAPDEVTNQLTAAVLQRHETTKGFVLDGFPRNTVQADAMDQMTDLTHALLITIPEEESIRRISNRRSCPHDSSTYHLLYKPPVKPNTCNQCGAQLVQRDDDFPEAVKKRLSIYATQTAPVFTRYKQRGIFHEIDGMPPIPQVYEQVKRILTAEIPQS